MLPPRRVAAIAASGMIVTTSPAASGSRRQPLISRITSRKSAATSAPETSRSAAFAAICGRSAGSGTGRACTPRIASRPTSATGAWSTKIDSQPKSCVRIPPIAGPTEAPTIPASAQMRAAEASAPDSLGEQVERGDDDGRPGHSLGRPQPHQHPERGREGAGERRGREDDRRDPEHSDRPPTRKSRRGHRSKRERQVERDQRPGERRDLDVELDEDLRERERDDRRVGQDEPDREAEQRNPVPRSERLHEPDGLSTKSARGS